jgi:hypothetical protein
MPLNQRRPRCPTKILPGSTKPRWTMTSLIVPATFSDALLQYPQAVWVRENDQNNPSGGVEEWNPADEGEDPWPSAEWQLVQARMPMTGIQIGYLYHGASTFVAGDPVLPGCPDPETGTEPYISTFGFEDYPLNDWRVFTDFDAVDVQSTCCD